MKTGWLSPTGEFIKCDVCDHIDTAIEIVGDNYRASDVLLKRGWVQISRSLIGNKEYCVYYDLHHNLTTEQTKFLRPYFEDDNIRMDSITRMRWKYEVEE